MSEFDVSLAPSEFREAVASIENATVRDDVSLAPFPSPTGLAPHAWALSADVTPAIHGLDSEWGTGRLIVLFDPEEPESWGGPWRIVCFAQAPLETEIGADPFLAEVTWSWLIDALAAHDAAYHSPSGTATKTISRGFGELAEEGEGAQIEIRASWSPRNGDLAAHVEAWTDLLAMLAGLPPTPENVSVLSMRRRTRE